MPEEGCEEQSRLALAVVAAINKVHDARRDLETVRERRVDVSQYEFALRNARLDERRAVSLLEAHKKDHGCQPASP